MATLHIRDIDDTLVRRLKAEAAMQGKTLKAYLTEFFATFTPLPSEVAEKIIKLHRTGKEETSTEADLPRHMLENQKRTGHALNCKCFICRPPKEK